MRYALFLPLALLLNLALAARADDTSPPAAGFVALFDGKSLAGWELVGSKTKDCWKAEGGLLVCTGGGGGWLMTTRQYADFDLRFEYRLSKRGNSGVAVRSPLKGRPSAVGMEIQVLDDANYKKDKLKPSQSTGSIYGIVPASKLAGKPTSEWNAMRVVAQGRRLRVEVNGETVVDADLDEAAKTKDGKNKPGLLRPSGHLGLQDHGGRLEFRNLWLKDLKAAK